MAGPAKGTAVPSTYSSSRARRGQPQPPIAACHLWSSGQFSPWKLRQSQPLDPYRKPNPSTTTGVTVGRRPSLTTSKSMPVLVTTSEIKKVPSRTTAPLFPDEILENLYLSDLETAHAVLSPNYAAPGRPQIRYVLSVLDKNSDAPQVIEAEGQQTVVQHFIKIHDWADVNLLQHFPEARDFIRQSLQKRNGGVLVHCRKGVSRSGSIMVAYVMETLGLDVDDAIKFVINKRPKVLPNFGFKRQLELWRKLNYRLCETDGEELREYVDWKESTRFRIC